MAPRSLAAVPDQPRRYVAYIRVSALMGREGEGFHSPEVQLRAIRAACAGGVEVAVVQDIDESGTTFARGGIDTIRKMAADSLIDDVAVYDISRFGRNVLESLIELRDLRGSGVEVKSACEQIDTTTPAGEMMLINMLNLAQYRAREIGASWARIIGKRAADGHHHGRPLGYERKGKRLTPHPVLGPAITTVFERYAAGDRIADICRGLAATRGRRIITTTVKKILRNPAYLGYVVAGGEVLPGGHEPLVDEQTWQRVQDRLARDAVTPARQLAVTWALVGLVHCPAGHHLQRAPSRRRPDAPLEDRLVCGLARTAVHGPGRCPGVGSPLLERVEAEVLRKVAKHITLLRDDHAARAARTARLSRARADRATLERELAKTRAAMAKLTRGWATGDVPDGAYQATIADLRAAETAARVELAKLAPARDAPEPLAAASAAEAMLGMWPDMTPAERGRALRSLVRRVVVRAATYWREPERDRVDVLFLW